MQASPHDTLPSSVDRLLQYLDRLPGHVFVGDEEVEADWESIYRHVRKTKMSYPAVVGRRHRGKPREKPREGAAAKDRATGGQEGYKGGADACVTKAGAAERGARAVGSSEGGEKVGDGGFAEVWGCAAPHENTVVKIVPHEGTKRRYLRNEVIVAALQRLERPRGLVRFRATQLTPRCALFYMKRYQGTLKQLKKRLLPSQVAKVAMDVLHGLAWLHRDHHYVHRDLKLANVLYTLSPTGVIEAAISDFGMVFAIGADRRRPKPNSLAGTELYAAPEQISSRHLSVYSYPVDIFALGVMLNILVTGRQPFNPVSEAEEAKMGRGAVDEATIAHVSSGILVRDVSEEVRDPLAADFIEQCLRVNPGERPTAQNLMEHRWFSHHNIH